MKVIWHQYIGMDGHIKQLGRLFEPVQKTRVILCMMKNHDAGITALDNMMLLVRDNKSG